MKYLFLLEYAIYIFINVDARIQPNFINFSHSYLFIIFTGLIIFEYLLIKACKLKTKINIPSKICFAYLSIIAIYTGTIFSIHSSNIEIQLSIMLIITVIFIGKMINELNCMKEFLLISFWVPTATLMLICLQNNINILELLNKLNIRYLFSTNYSMRLRADFNFYNVNAAGNLSACLLCIVSIIKYINVHNNTFYRIAFFIAVLFDGVILLLTGSRTAILSVIICYGIILLNIILAMNFIRKYQRIILKVFSILSALVCLCILNVKDFFVVYFISRNFAFENLVFMKSLRQKLFGLGLIPPGNFLNLRIDHQKGNFLDNYYLYVYLTMGLIGLIVICITLIYIGIGLLKKSKIRKMYFSVFACFAACIIGGFAETSVLYHLFPSCAIYFSIFFAILDKKERYQEVYRII